MVEATHDGWFESPSFSAWGDSKWGGHLHLGRLLAHSSLLSSTFVNNTFNEHNQITDDYGNYWSRDFLYPLYAGPSATPIRAARRGPLRPLFRPPRAVPAEARQPLRRQEHDARRIHSLHVRARRR